MLVEIQEIGVDLLSYYAAIPIAFRVTSVFRIEAIEDGLGGFTLTEEKVAPYVKDYDRHDNGSGPTGWPKRFDVSK